MARLMRRRLVAAGRYLGSTTPSRRIDYGMSAVDPAQVPQTLMEPAMDAGHPPDPPLENITRIMPSPGARVEYASFRRSDLDPDDPGEITAAINRMAAQGWRLVTFDGERYILERPQRDTDVHER